MDNHSPKPKGKAANEEPGVLSKTLATGLAGQIPAVGPAIVEVMHALELMEAMSTKAPVSSIKSINIKPENAVKPGRMYVASAQNDQIASDTSPKPSFVIDRKKKKRVYNEFSTSSSLTPGF